MQQERGTDTWASRTLTAPAAGLTITNPAGTAGNPTFALANDLAAVEGLATNGIATRTGTDTWTTRTVTGTAGRTVVTNGDGVAGNPTIDLASGIIASPGTYTSVTVDTYGRVTAGTNPAGVTITTINGQPVPTFVDTTRTNKVLSVETATFVWAEATVGNSDWIQVGTAVDALTGYIMPHNATIVKVTGHTSNTNGNTKAITLFIDAVNSGTIGTFTGAGEQEFSSVTTNIDVTAGQKLRLQGDAAGGTIEDTVITLFV
ncbi:MAG: hypothetical protein HC836_23205, partial [Richelia sp. RM2_1_2]|nr:hypothetical protein [Richelia sp. RM2_1_2]